MCGGGQGGESCYNLESAGSQAPGPDVRACRRRSDILCQGGQYVLTVVSRHYVACEHLRVRKSSYNQASISHICYGPVPQSQAITTTSQSSETHLKGIRPRVMHCHTYATQHPHATPPCMRALAPSYDKFGPCWIWCPACTLSSTLRVGVPAWSLADGLAAAPCTNVPRSISRMLFISWLSLRL